MPRATEPRPPTRTAGPGRLVAALVSLAVLVLGLVLTAVAVEEEQRDGNTADTVQLERSSTRRAQMLDRGLDGVADLVVAAAAFQATSTGGEDAFDGFVDRLGHQEGFRVHAIQWVEAVERSELGDFERSLAAAGHAGMLDVRSIGDQLAVVAYGDEAGLDVGSFPRLREAFDEATATGEATASLPIGEETGFVRPDHDLVVAVVAPVYEPDRPIRDEAQRSAAIAGWIVAPVVVADLLVADVAADEVEIVTDVRVGGDDTTIAHLTPLRAAPRTPDEVVTTTTQSLGRTWSLTTAPGAAFPRSPSSAGVLWLVGSVASVALAGVVLLASLRRSRLAVEVAEAERAAEHFHRQFRLAFDEAPVGIAISDLEGNLLQANDALRDLVGAVEDGDPHRTLADSALEEDLPTVWENLQKLVTGEVSHLVTERQLRRNDGSLVWVRITSSPLVGPDGVPTALVGHVQDITVERDAAAATEALRHRAFHDDLTGLATRDVMVESLARSLGRARRQSTSVALLFLDLDRFKQVNDRFGHPAGDALLCSVAGSIEACVRPGDTVARHGGDEFAVLLDPIDGLEEAMAVADRIRRTLADPVTLEGGIRLTPGASIGVALSNGYTTAEAMLRDADAALYSAKASGRNRVAVFDEHLRARAVRRLSTELLLRHALDDGSILLRFEPVVDLQSGGIVGAEASIRLVQPSGELVPTSEIMPVAEETGLVLTLGAGAIEGACRTAAAWSEAGGASRWVGIDVTPQELSHPTFSDRLRRTIDASGVDPSCLRLEVPDSVVTDLSGPAHRTLREARALGVRIVLDGVGSDLRLLASLGALGIDGLKLDLSWLPDIVEDRAAAAVLGSVVPVSEVAGIPVVVTGADREEQVAVVRDLGFRFVQGAAVAPVLDTDDLVGLRG